MARQDPPLRHSEFVDARCRGRQESVVVQGGGVQATQPRDDECAWRELARQAHGGGGVIVLEGRSSIAPRLAQDLAARNDGRRCVLCSL